ncbi:NYN domain-containing protein [Pararhizobium antarcticum]|uniref:NYN domain-containing protein n=1 Tax=Pararhizobium antarcticum TaxID=1798805 RepID=A0A657LQ61_9HYPH|nr:NYN domain-containing protein [Pararhizobium antarcticum]OJF93429.1 hypothetical protein AX760_05360 [Pararhizobium antarcticum]OJG00467.1 hypothetical protein AX761_08610 [Rhizobium sp. 58]
MEREKNRVAVLIDAENVSHLHAKPIFDDIEMLGPTVVRRAYGNFASGHGKGWFCCQGKFALDLVQVGGLSSRKNASDIRMAIDAIELLRSADVDHFCLASGDSDFTPLAVYLRAAGKSVTGYGGQNAADCLREACNRFVNLMPAKPERTASPAPSVAASAVKVVAVPGQFKSLVFGVSGRMSADTGGWFAVSVLASNLRLNDPTFSVKTFGCATLGKALKQLPGLCFEQRKNGLFYKFQNASAPSPSPKTHHLSVVSTSSIPILRA